jgi:hypothetical protein
VLVLNPPRQRVSSVTQLHQGLDSISMSVGFPKEPDRIKMLQAETQWIDLSMANGAGGLRLMFCELLPNRGSSADVRFDRVAGSSLGSH